MEDKERQRLEEIISEMKNEASQIQGNEFGIFDYNDLDEEKREQKWQILSYIIDMNKMRLEDTATLFQNNPFFYDWYKRNILSEIPISETYH
jgi:hypothetical protein|tara:strand:- start:402 stop:677 length:276 start_codon:yes stop_codon:yes gene_type:complete